MSTENSLIIRILLLTIFASCGKVCEMKPPTIKVETLDHISCGRQIRRARRKKSMPQKLLAKKLGIAPSSLNDLEKANRKWTEERFSEAKRFIADYNA